MRGWLRAEPPLSGGGEDTTPNLDTKGITPNSVPLDAALYGPVLLTEKEYRAQVAQGLTDFATTEYPQGKLRRSWKRKAQDMTECGQMVVASQCNTCGAVDGASGRILTTCGLRTCPTCARYRADILRAKIDQIVKDAETNHELGYYHIVFTQRFDPSNPDEFQIKALSDRIDLVKKSVAYVWTRVLKGPGHAMLRAVEVSTRGMVHAHVLYYGRRKDIDTIRTAYMLKAGDSPLVRIDYVKNPKIAVREVAKYAVKGPSPKRKDRLAKKKHEYMDPRLAARVEIAVVGKRLVEFYGAWRIVNLDEESEELLAEIKPRPCPHCGAVGTSVSVRMQLEHYLIIAKPYWKPGLTKTGNDPPYLRSDSNRENEVQNERRKKRTARDRKQGLLQSAGSRGPTQGES
ncbi:MAG: transposase zinc-binding domain-containing protein [Deltaproteobacteria bacterium]|nr:transposase zinc-binding domain-containing protein [Deltaproteobacteria bacterium]